MKILHITDLHYKDNSTINYNIDKIVNLIYEENKSKGLNYIFFTGDLVFSGGNLDDFRKASQLVLESLASKLNIPKENVFICGGNHDVFRNQEMSVIKEKLFNLTSEDDLNVFLKDKNQFAASIKNIENYCVFQNEFYQKNDLKSGESDLLNELYTVHKRNFEGRDFHIVTINTGWRSNDSKTDEGNLLFPTQILKKVIGNLPKDDFKILLLHHPLTDLKYWNRLLVEDIIYDNFHIMMHGHIHKSMNSSILRNSDGIISISTDASLSKINAYEHIGFTTIELNIEEMNVKMDKYRIDSDFTLYLYGTHKIDIPVNEEKRELLDFRKKVIKLQENEMSKAKQIFVSDSEHATSLNELFSEPILKTTSSSSLNNIAKKNDLSRVVDIEFIENDFNTNYFIYGKDKFGKTSILYYLYINYLINMSKHKVLPIYIDCSSKGEHSDIEDIFIKNYHINKNFLNQLMKDYKVRLLLDDYHKISSEFKLKLEKFIIKNKNVTYITSIEENILSDFKDITIDSTLHTKLYIHDLTTTQVRNVTKRTLNCDIEKTEEIIIKIKSVFRQLNLPMNYWTVSLFLWIFNNSNEQNFHNNFELIQLYIDNLLDRQNIVTDRDIKIEYETLKIFLSELAIELIKEHHKDNYKIKYSALVNFIEEYKIKNRRLVITTEALLKIIIEKGILKQINDEGLYTFRLKGVFEYFVAYYLKDNKKTRDEIINDNHVYLSFGNELELVSGFNKQDSDFLTKIFSKSALIFQPINNEYNSIGNADEILKIKSSTLSLKLKDVTAGVQSLIINDIDTISEELNSTGYGSEVSAKPIYDEIKLNSDNLEKTLFIMSRVFRNSSVNNDKLTSQILDFILESACNLCFLAIDESESSPDNDDNVYKIFSNFIPLVIQNFLFDALAQNNLENIFLDKINEIKEMPGNELKVFVLYYMIIELDIKSNKKYIDDVINILKNSTLKHASMYKLFSLLLFKRYNSDYNKDFLEKAVIKQSKQINNSKEFTQNILKGINNIASQNRLKK